MSNGDATAPAPVPVDQGDQTDDLLKKAAQQTAQPRKSLPNLAPTSVPTQWRGQGFLGSLISAVHNAAAGHKEKQIRTAMNDWGIIQKAYDDSQLMPPDKQNQAFRQLADPVLSDPKKLKNIAKTFSLDPLDPKKNLDATVYGQALKRHLQADQAGKHVKMVQGLQQQLAARQQMGDVMAQRIGGMGSAGGVDVKSATEVAKAQSDLNTSRANLTKAQAELRDKYDFKPDAQGNLLALDKSTGQGKPVTYTTVTGKEITATGPAAKMTPKVATVDGVPMGISRVGSNGQATLVTPQSPEWTAQDAKLLEAANAAYSKGEAEKSRLAGIHQSYFGSLPQGVLFKQDVPGKGKAGELGFVSRQEAGAHPELYAPPAQADQALLGQARFGEIQQTVNFTNDAISKLPDDAWDTTSRAQLALVMKSPNPNSALSTFLQSEAATTLTEAQVNYVTALASMIESAQAMTSIQGIGQRGSDKLRATITAMLPTAGTPTRSYAQRQMKLFQVELTALKKGLPTLGPLTPGDSSGTPSTGTAPQARRITVN